MAARDPQHKAVSLVPDELHPREAHRLFLSAVVPRPIAWVSTVARDGAPNIAPFSFFNGVASKPLTVMISVGRRAGGVKDTLRNVEETGEFVVNLVDEELAMAMNLTSGEYGHEVNEFEVAGIVTAPSVDVKPPRVANAPIAMEAKLGQLVPVEGTTSTLILGRVVRFHIREGLLRPEGLIDASLMHPISRLGGDEYATLGKVFAMSRPKT